jgi:DNA-binding Xre family transcriptional regulator
MSWERILSFAEIKEGLKDKRLYVVAEETSLSYPTLKKLADGEESNCTIDTLRTISDYLNNN